MISLAIDTSSGISTRGGFCAISDSANPPVSAYTSCLVVFGDPPPSNASIS